MNTNEPIVEIRNVCKAYHRGSHLVPVLEDITFTIAQGEFLAIMGPSGSGKSTLLNLIAGIDRVDSGSIMVGGEDITCLVRDRACKMARRQCRIHLPVLQPHPRAHRLRKRGSAASPYDPFQGPKARACGDGIVNGEPDSTAWTTTRTSSPAANSSAWP